MPIHFHPGQAAVRAACSAALCVALLGAAGTLHAAGCPPTCVVLDSVVHAAGVPTGMRRVVESIEFQGDRLTPEGRKAVGELAAQMKQLPARAVTELKVSGDRGAGATLARSQAQARRTALATALGQAGAQAAQFRVSAD